MADLPVDPAEEQFLAEQAQEKEHSATANHSRP